jgi:hypothetical protein
MNTAIRRTTVSLNKNTKARLDKWRANGQCYDGFLCELVSLWERTHDPDNRYQTDAIMRRMMNETVERSLRKG